MLRFRKKDRGDPEIASDILFSNFFFGRKKKKVQSHSWLTGFVLDVLVTNPAGVFLKKIVFKCLLI